MPRFTCCCRCSRYRKYTYDRGIEKRERGKGGSGRETEKQKVEKMPCYVRTGPTVRTCIHNFRIQDGQVGFKVHGNSGP